MAPGQLDESTVAEIVTFQEAEIPFKRVYRARLRDGTKKTISRSVFESLWFQKTGTKFVENAT